MNTLEQNQKLIRALLAKERYNFDDLCQVVSVLRGEGGCPWDIEQTHHTIRTGMIEECYEVVEAIDKEDSTLLREELERIYYTPKIRRILSMKERYGFSYWQVDTDDGEVSFTVQDTFRNLLRIGEDRVAVFDVDGNRFEIESLLALDRKSYKKIELYL